MFGDPAYDPVARPWAQPLANLLDQANIEVPPVPRPEDGQADWLIIDSPLAAGQALKRKTEGPFGGSVTAQVAWRDPRTAPQAPALDSPWKTDQAWRLPLAGPVFVFGEFGAAPDPVTPDGLKLKGRTGVGCKIPVGRLQVQVQGGRSLSYSDPLGSDRGEHSQLFLELQCRCPLPLPGQIGLEYQGSAVPALTPQERDKINQDLGLAIPVGDAGRVRLGAKHQWENTPTTTARSSWLDGMQLYLGFELGQGVAKQ
jgi:hypothetical protein